MFQKDSYPSIQLCFLLVFGLQDLIDSCVIMKKKNKAFTVAIRGLDITVKRRVAQCDSLGGEWFLQTHVFEHLLPTW